MDESRDTATPLPPLSPDAEGDEVNDDEDDEDDDEDEEEEEEEYGSDVDAEEGANVDAGADEEDAMCRPGTSA